LSGAAVGLGGFTFFCVTEGLAFSGSGFAVRFNSSSRARASET
jgi:hypothetical protein